MLIRHVVRRFRPGSAARMPGSSVRARRVPWWWPPIAMSALVSVPVRAAAQPAGGITLRWLAPVDCPDGDAVRQRVVALAGPAVTLDAVARVTPAGPATDGVGFDVSLHVSVGGSIGERTLHAPTCAAAAEAVAVVLAMSGTGAPEAPPPPVPPPLPAPVVPPPARVAPPPAENPSPQPTAPSHGRVVLPGIRLAAEAAADIGTLPHPTAGLTLRADVAPWRGLTVGLAGTLWLAQTGFLSGTSGPGATFDLSTFDAFGCYAALRKGPLDVSPCATVELGRLVGSGTGAGTTGDTSSTAYWVGLGLGLRARWELTRWLALALSVDGVVPTAQQGFGIQTSLVPVIVRSVHATSVVAGRGAIGPEVRF